jgi:hypothetical protein
VNFRVDEPNVTIFLFSIISLGEKFIDSPTKQGSGRKDHQMMSLKRKRETRITTRASDGSLPKGIQVRDRDVFKQYFERRFKPLPAISTELDKSVQMYERKDPADTPDDDDLSGWEGFSDDESTIHVVDVVEYMGDGHPPEPLGDKRRQKEFMVRAHHITYTNSPFEPTKSELTIANLPLERQSARP